MAEKDAARADWRGPFLRALERGCSARAAAKRAGMDHRTAFSARSRDPAFAELWERALAKGQTLLVQREMPALRDDEVVGRCRGKTCILRVGEDRWSAKKERLFLAGLARTANVSMAAEAAGVTATALYARRKQWPRLAERWDTSVEEGQARVESALVCAANRTLEGAEPDEDDHDELAMRDMTVGEAINVYREHLRGPLRNRKRRGRVPAPPTLEQVRDEVLRRLKALGG